MLMISLDKGSSEALVAGKERDHVVLWYRTDIARDRVVSGFVEDGGERGDLIAIALCLGDFGGLEKAMSKTLHSLDDLIGSGNLMLFVSCEFLPGKDRRNVTSARDTFAKLELKAKSERRDLRLISTVPFAALATGDSESCLEMERGNESLERGRLLCLYDTRMLHGLMPEDMSRINALHSHVLVEGGNGGVVSSIAHAARPRSKK